MLNFSPFPGQNVTAAGEIALYERLKEMSEWMWECLTCKLPCCLDDEYDNLNEEEEEPQPAQQNKPFETEQIGIETQVPNSKRSRKQLSDIEEVKYDIEDIESQSTQGKKSTQFEDLELSNLANSDSKSPMAAFPKEEFFLIKSSYCQMLAQIREVRLTTPAAFVRTIQKWLKEDNSNHSKLNDTNFGEITASSNLQKLYEERYLLFSRYREGIKINKDDWQSTAPEAVTQYIAKRLGSKFKTVVDAFCGAGSNTIQVIMTTLR